jgi:glycerophosphoryl diester phosphodiesterase
MTRLLATTLLMLSLPTLALSQDKAAAALESLYRIDAKTPAGLQAIFQHTDEPLPLVSAHRGGGELPGFPENCLPTFEHTLAHSFAMLEIDPRYSKDGQIVLVHDATLDRTTTGRGKVADFTVQELKQLRLKDAAGNVTEYQIPTLDEALKWARGKTILVLDQKDVPVAARVKAIESHQAESYAMLIVNSFHDAAEAYRLNPHIMLEVMIPNRDKVVAFDKLNIPWRNVIAFVGHDPPEDLKLYELIHARGACCMIGTSRNLDRKFVTGKVKELREIENDYRAFLKRGADVIETDIPVQVGPLLYHATPVPASKREFFHAPQNKSAD